MVRIEKKMTFMGIACRYYLEKKIEDEIFIMLSEWSVFLSLHKTKVNLQKSHSHKLLIDII